MKKMMKASLILGGTLLGTAGILTTSFFADSSAPTPPNHSVYATSGSGQHVNNWDYLENLLSTSQSDWTPEQLYKMNDTYLTDPPKTFGYILLGSNLPVDNEIQNGFFTQLINEWEKIPVPHYKGEYVWVRDGDFDDAFATSSNQFKNSDFSKPQDFTIQTINGEPMESFWPKDLRDYYKDYPERYQKEINFPHYYGNILDSFNPPMGLGFKPNTIILDTYMNKQYYLPFTQKNYEYLIHQYEKYITPPPPEPNYVPDGLS